jgi:hypothetical protein
LSDVPFFGSGDGNAAKYYAQTGHAFILENSLFQILIGFGFLLGIILLLILILVVLTSVPFRYICLIFPMLALLASSNAWEGSRNLHVFFGAIILIERARGFSEK